MQFVDKIEGNINCTVIKFISVYYDYSYIVCLNSCSEDGISNAVIANCCYTNEYERRKLQEHVARLSALGAYQVEVLRREFKSFTDVVEKSIKELKESMNSTVKSRKIRIFKVKFFGARL